VNRYDALEIEKFSSERRNGLWIAVEEKVNTTCLPQYGASK
jgi:hypothetical protein